MKDLARLDSGDWSCDFDGFEVGVRRLGNTFSAQIYRQNMLGRGHGDTPEEALADAKKAMRHAIELEISDWTARRYWLDSLRIPESES